MTEIDDYLATVPDDAKKELERVRAVIAAQVPDAVEGISYGMPAFRYDGRPLIGFTASKAHLSLHPFSPAVIEAEKDRLEGFSLSKGTIRFSPAQPLPDATLKAILARRLAEIRGA